MNQQRTIFSINISSQEYLLHYQGVASQVCVTDINGKIIQFPANLLRQFVTHDGISGSFEMSFDENHRFTGINKLE